MSNKILSAAGVIGCICLLLGTAQIRFDATNVSTKTTSNEGHAISEEMSSSSAAKIFDIMKRMESGERAAEEIDHELNRLAGHSAFSMEKVSNHRKYKLSMIVTHFNELESGLQIMSVHSLDAGTGDEIVTMFTERVNDAVENSIGASLVTARTLEVADGAFHSEGKARYNWRLKPDPARNNFRLREPEALFSIENSPAALRTAIDPFNVDSSSPVEVNVREGEHGTLTVETHIRASSDEDDTLQTYTFLMVYEPIQSQLLTARNR